MWLWKSTWKKWKPKIFPGHWKQLTFFADRFCLHHWWGFQESKYELNMKICTLNQQRWPPEILQPVSQPISPASKKHENYCNERGSNISKQIPLQTLIWGEEIQGLSPVVGDNLVGLQEKIAWAVDKRQTRAVEHYTNAEDAAKMPELPGNAGWRCEVDTTVLPSSKGKQLQDSIKHSYSECQWGPFIFRTVRKHGPLWRVFLKWSLLCLSRVRIT